MKLNFKFLLILVTGLFIGFSSCSNDDDNNLVPEGLPTEMKLSITQSGVFSTRDDNANADEALFKTVDVFIYNANTGGLEKHVTLDGQTDFSYEVSGNVYLGTTKISATTGPKSIYIGVNLTNALAAQIVKDGPSIAQSIDNVSQLTSGTTGFVMFATDPTITTLVENGDDPANTVNARVKRLATKVAIQATSGLSLDLGNGMLSDLRFSVRNNNKRFFPLPFIDATIVKDPNWSSEDRWIIMDADFYPSRGDLTDAEYIAVNPSTITDNKNLTPKYTVENTSENQFGDELTFASIRAKFIPNKVIEYTNGTDAGGGFSTVDNPSGGVETFYRVSLPNGTSVYTVGANGLATAQDYATANIGSIVRTYSNGYCYYNVFLNPAKNYNVYRNDFYKVTVSKINGVGNHIPDDLTHDKLGSPTDITVNVEILDWNLVDLDTQLPGSK